MQIRLVNVRPAQAPPPPAAHWRARTHTAVWVLWLGWIAATIVAGFLPGTAHKGDLSAGEATLGAGAGPLFGMQPGDELLQFEDFPTVISATRQATSANLSAIPVYVINSRQIHNSGATTIPQVLQYAPDMDVLKIDRNHSAVGIRGTFSFANDRILSLVDGIKATDPITGATDYQRYPIFLEDIQRIEIVRGPTGAAWGANAFFGVINVLTKDPIDTQGWLAQSTADQFGDNWSQLRWGSHAGSARWRISAGYLNQLPSAVALQQDFAHDDGSRQATIDSKLVVEPSEKTLFTFGLAYSHSERDAMTFLSYTPNRGENVDEIRASGRLEQKISDLASTTWTASLNYADQILPSLYSARTLETGLEGQWNYKGITNHDLSIGGSFRYVLADQFHREVQDFQFRHDPNTEIWGGLFMVDRWKIAEQAWLEAQVRGDLFQFDERGQNTDWSGRLSTIIALDAAQNHVLRFSGAKAYRAPTLLLRDTNLMRVALPTPPFPPDTFALNVSSASQLKTETVWSAEAGYSGRFSQSFDLQVNGYYQRYLNLLSLEQVASAPPQSYYSSDNLPGAFGWGGSIELNYHLKMFEFKAWYAYNGFRAETATEILRASPPSPNKVGARIEFQPAENWVATINYRYCDVTPGDAGAVITARAFHQVDLSVLRQFPAIHGELLLGVSDLLNDTSIAVQDIGAVGTPHDTPGRRYVGRFQLEF